MKILLLISIVAVLLSCTKKQASTPSTTTNNSPNSPIVGTWRLDSSKNSGYIQYSVLIKPVTYAYINYSNNGIWTSYGTNGSSTPYTFINNIVNYPKDSTSIKVFKLTSHILLEGDLQNGFYYSK